MTYTFHGSARWHGFDEAVESGLIEIAAFPITRHGLWLGSWIDAEGGGRRYQVRYNGDKHQLIVAGTGGGKFTSALAPMLMMPRSVESATLIIDPKGELARVTGRHYQSLTPDRKRVFVIDPYGISGFEKTDCFNILDLLPPDSPTLLEDAQVLGEALVLTSSAKETHWDDTARNLAASLLAYLVYHPHEEGRRTLHRLRDILCGSEFKSTILRMGHSKDMLGGALRRAAGEWVQKDPDKEQKNSLSGLTRDTRWLEYPLMRECLNDGLDLADLVQSDARIYVCLPPEFLHTHRIWLRLIINAFTLACRRNYAQKDGPSDYRDFRHIIIDEFPALGKMLYVYNDISVGRGYGLKYTLVAQNLGQLRHLYDDGWQSFISGCFTRAFAVDDYFTAETFSKYLGNQTIEYQQISVSSQYSSGTSDTINSSSRGGTEGSGSSHSTQRSYNSGTSYTPHYLSRPLLFPDEIMRLPAQAQLIFMRGLNPICCGRHHYFEPVMRSALLSPQPDHHIYHYSYPVNSTRFDHVQATAVPA